MNKPKENEVEKGIRKLVEIEVLDYGESEKAIYKDGKKVGSEQKIQVLYLGENKFRFLGKMKFSDVQKVCWSDQPIKKKGRQLFYAKIVNVDGNEYLTLEGNYEG